MKETEFDQTLITEEFCKSQVTQKSKVDEGLKLSSAGVIGAIAGASATIAGQSIAANHAEVEAVVEENADEEIVIATTCATEAHVSDDMSFSQAFMEARHQVGAGGVFKWRGNVYGTYYKEEWDSMTADERAEFQNSIPTVPSAANGVEEVSATRVEDTVVVVEDDIIYEDSNNGNMNVLGVEHNVNLNGQPVDIARIEIDGYQGILVDVDHDGVVEGAIIDFNDDGEIQQEEISPDLTEAQIEMPQEQYLADSNDVPDYVNDAIV